MNHLAEENPKLMTVSHSNQLLKMPSAPAQTIHHLEHYTPKTINKSLYKNMKLVNDYKISVYAHRIPPVISLLKNKS